MADRRRPITTDCLGETSEDAGAAVSSARDISIPILPDLPDAPRRRHGVGEPGQGAARTTEGAVAKRPNAAGCKPAGSMPSEVRILPAPPLASRTFLRLTLPDPLAQDLPMPSAHPRRRRRSAASSPGGGLQIGTVARVRVRAGRGGRLVTHAAASPPAPAPADIRRAGAPPFDSGGDTPLSCCDAGVAQSAEHQPSKLRVAGSRPVSRSSTGRRPSHGRSRPRAVAPSPVALRFRPRGSVVEHFLGKEGVTGSTPVVGSTFAAVPKRTLR